VDALADDIATACRSLEQKGPVHPSERRRVKTGTGY
jgi:glutamate decarboxylase